MTPTPEIGIFTITLEVGGNQIPYCSKIVQCWLLSGRLAITEQAPDKLLLVQFVTVTLKTRSLLLENHKPYPYTILAISFSMYRCNIPKSSALTTGSVLFSLPTCP